MESKTNLFFGCKFCDCYFYKHKAIESHVKHFHEIPWKAYAGMFPGHEVKVKITVHCGDQTVDNDTGDTNNNEKEEEVTIMEQSECRLVNVDCDSDDSHIDVEQIMKQELIADEEHMTDVEDTEAAKTVGVNKSMVAHNDANNDTDKENYHELQTKLHHCKKCNASFRDNYQLKRHQNVHTKERPFKCEECGSGFKDKAHLKRHSLVHTTEKPHKCSYCGSKFKSKTQLSQHYIVHSSERPFKCEECGSQFKAKTQLTRHRLVHTMARPFQCAHCEAKFKNKESLRRHGLVHTIETPFKCVQCDKAFKSMDKLRLHRQRVHSNELF